MSLLESTGASESLGAPSGTSRLFAASAPDHATHVRRFGPTPAVTDQQHLISELEAAGLEGRGGAGFATWRKLAAIGPAARSNAVVIANASEGEPASAKDAVLLAKAPHLVIDGLLLAAAAVGARELYVYAGRDQLDAVARALKERTDAKRILLREAPDAFVSGEASAVVNSIGSGVALPKDHIVRMTESGLRGRPTLVHNVETLAHLALIARFGAAWFRSVGTADEPGTRLFTVSLDGGERHVIELAGGIPLGTALRAAGIEPSDVRAVLVGGYHGGWVPANALTTALTRAELKKFGASPGAGVLVVLPRGRCGLRSSARIATYLANQSARQCGPCVNGLPAMASVLTSLATQGRDDRLPREVRRLAELVRGRGSCHHPDGTSRLVLSTLSAFEADVAAHLKGRCLEVADR
jgi:NADH:ubiquinone oxidoreductase subunit F (NADH-binding)